jgi:hypothetical protein
LEVVEAASCCTESTEEATPCGSVVSMVEEEEVEHASCRSVEDEEEEIAHPLEEIL